MGGHANKTRKMKVNFEFLELIIAGSAGSLPPSKTPFEALYTDEGFQNARAWFEQQMTQVIDGLHYLNETQFINFLRQLTDFNDFEIFEIFDIFGTYIIHNTLPSQPPTKPIFFVCVCACAES